MAKDLKNLKVIKDYVELDEYIKSNSSDPYFNNVIIFNGSTQVLNQGMVYPLDTNWVEDYYHPGHYIRYGKHYSLITKLRVTSGRGKFSKRDEDTWIRVDEEPRFTGSPRNETKDAERFALETKEIFHQYRATSPFRVQVSDEDMLSLGFLKGKYNEGYWFHKDEIAVLDSCLPYKKFDHTYSFVDVKTLEGQMKDLGHKKKDISDAVNATMKKNILFGVDSLSYSSFEGLEYTFGVEIETSIGRPTDEDIKELNVKAVHDGSLRDKDGNTPGGEYVTGVLKGDSGLAQIYELCRVLSSRCKVNAQCGVHVHVGSLGWGKDDVVYSYILAEMLEKELFAMLPSSRRNNSYCRALTPITKTLFAELSESTTKSDYNILIDQLYSKIYEEVSFIKTKNSVTDFVARNRDNEVTQSTILVNNSTINKAQNHPLGTKCGYDKNAQRYCWLNFVTLLYDTKGNPNARTLEFRSHSATMNFIKIRNWIKICLAFCKFVEDHKNLINTGNVSLKDVIMTIYPKTGKDLVDYIVETY